MKKPRFYQFWNSLDSDTKKLLLFEYQKFHSNKNKEDWILSRCTRLFEYDGFSAGDTLILNESKTYWQSNLLEPGMEFEILHFTPKFVRSFDWRDKNRQGGIRRYMVVARAIKPLTTYTNAIAYPEVVFNLCFFDKKDNAIGYQIESRDGQHHIPTEFNSFEILSKKVTEQWFAENDKKTVGEFKRVTIYEGDIEEPVFVTK